LLISIPNAINYTIAIENWQHDLNIGSIVRTANAFNASYVHIVGKRDWNKRGAMVTDRYLNDLNITPQLLNSHSGVLTMRLPLLVSIMSPASNIWKGAELPEKCAPLLGQEGAGMSEEVIQICGVLYAIEQYGSTRSMNASGSRSYCDVSLGVAALAS
jgi:tRNA G18 (ribose-2'-O)-methylase SpoU